MRTPKKLAPALLLLGLATVSGADDGCVRLLDVYGPVNLPRGRHEVTFDAPVTGDGARWFLTVSRVGHGSGEVRLNGKTVVREQQLQERALVRMPVDLAARNMLRVKVEGRTTLSVVVQGVVPVQGGQTPGRPVADLSLYERTFVIPSRGRGRDDREDRGRDDRDRGDRDDRGRGDRDDRGRNDRGRDDHGRNDRGRDDRDRGRDDDGRGRDDRGPDDGDEDCDETVQVALPATQGLFTLEVRQGSVRASKVALAWNGEEVLRSAGRDLRDGVASAPITVRAANSLKVELRGRPGASVTVRLAGLVVDEVPPEASWSAPTPGALLVGDAPLLASFSDALSGIRSARLELNGIDVTSAFDLDDTEARSTRSRLPAEAVRPGENSLRAIVRDRACNEAAVATTFLVDLLPPTLEQPPDLVVEQGSPAGSLVTFDVPRATDDTDPAPVVVCSPAPGALFAPGTTTVTCTATDHAGLSSQVTFSVTVVDRTPPALEAPSDLIVEQDGPAGSVVTYGTPTATDAADPAPSVECAPAPGTVFPPGETIVTCAAVDAAGNRTEVTFSVTVLDRTPPVLDPAPDLTVEQTSPGGAVVTFDEPRAVDRADPAPIVTCTPASGSLFPAGSTAVVCSATDAAGNARQTTFVVTVRDTIVPELVLEPLEGAVLASDQVLLRARWSDSGAGVDPLAARAVVDGQDATAGFERSDDGLSATLRLGAGAHTFQVTVRDFGGNERTEQVSFHVQTSAATVARLELTIGAPPRGAPPDEEALLQLAPELRSLDGAGNDLQDPLEGAAGAAFLRNSLAPAYADGVSAPAGPGRRSARDISNAVLAQTGSVKNDRRATDYLWIWGQFVSHDLSLTPPHAPAEPLPVPVAPDDPIWVGFSELPFLRSAYDPVAVPRAQLNVLTAWLDGSMIYGSDAARASALRANDGSGRLRTSPGDLLPRNIDGLDNLPTRADPSLFLAGDVRANQNVTLLALHTVFVREHNRLAGLLQARFPDAGDEELYQAARRIVIAELQAITYQEFLPLLLGPEALSLYSGYDPSAEVGIDNAFAAAAFRLGHSLLSPTLLRVDAQGLPIPEGPLAVRDAFFAPAKLTEGGGLEPLLRGAARQLAQQLDAGVVDDVRSFLFGPPSQGGLDLVALDIQRGRDHGIPGYNEARRQLGLVSRASFDEVTSDRQLAARLASAYASVEDVDLLVGALCEDHVPGALVGEVLLVLLRRQFELLRDGDRFFYRSAFSGEALQALERTRLADVIRRNTAIGAELPDDVFRVPLLPFTENDLTVRAVTEAGETATTFTGFVQVTASDGRPPLDGFVFELTAEDQGQVTFPGLAFFRSLGPIVVTARTLPLQPEDAAVTGSVTADVGLEAPVIFPALPELVAVGDELLVEGAAFVGQQVELIIDGQLVATEVAGPTGGFLLSVRLAPGPHQVIVRSLDPATGQLVSSQALSVEQEAPAAVALEAEPPALQVAVGQGRALAITQRFADQTARVVTSIAGYASSDDGVATVSSEGLVVGRAVGSATITVDLGGLSTVVVVNVGVPVLVETSPTAGETDVAVSRETVLRFSAPVDPTTVTSSAVRAEFAGAALDGALHVSADGRTVTLFYAQPLPTSARVRVTVRGDLLEDLQGNPIDVDRDGEAGGTHVVDFDTLTVTAVPGTVAYGRVFASGLARVLPSDPTAPTTPSTPYEGGEPGAEGELGSVNVPLAGARISVVGAEDTLFCFTDALGSFRLDPAPAGTFFVHIYVPVPPGEAPIHYYRDLGRPLTTIAGEETSVGDFFLPLIADRALQPVSDTEDTTVSFLPETTLAFPELVGTQITVPAGSLYSASGSTEPKRVGIAPVPPDRLPAPLPPGLEFSVVFSIQVAGGDNFDIPAPVRLPNREGLPPGAKSALWSFNHDTGQWEVVGSMTVTEDGLYLVTDSGVGVLAPGWHGSQSGSQGEGGESGEGDEPGDGDLPEPGDEQETQDSEGADKEDCNIFLHNGEETFERVDLAIPGRGHLSFVMRRRYRSQLVYDGPLGHGWDFDYNEFLRVEPDGDVIRVNGRGHVDRWARLADGRFAAPVGFFGALSQRPDGVYVLREPNGFQALYDPHGRLVQHRDRFGNHMDFVHDEHGDLDLVIDVYGREIDFSFQAFADGKRRLTRVRDFAGREVLYGYDQHGDLVSVRSPVVVGTSTGNDFPSGRVERYTYTSGFEDPRLNHNIRTLTHAEEVATGGPPALVWTYGEDPTDPLMFDRVIERLQGGTNASGVPAGGTIRLAYSVLNESVPPGDLSVVRRRTRITERSGTVREHDFNERNLEIAERVYTRGLRPGEPEYYETRSSYDADGQIVRRVFPEGNETRWTYAAGARAGQKNVVELRRIAGPRGADGRGAPAEDLVTTFTYEPLYNEVLTITDPRGNSASFVPPLGERSAGRYTARTFYDYQEHDDPVPQAEALGIDLSTIPRGLGDLNGDGRTDQSFGNVVRVEAPAVLLPEGSFEAQRLGTTTQVIVEELRWNDRGQLLARVDAEGNLSSFDYHPEDDPDGDGRPTRAMFRAVSSAPTGYQKMIVRDAGTTPRRTSTVAPTQLTTLLRYDAVGNVVAAQDPRGVVTEFEVNALNEVVVATRGADVAVAAMLGEIRHDEAPLRYRVRYHRDHCGRVVKEEVENRDSNTAGVGPWVERTFTYDLLSNVVRSTVEVDASTQLVTQYRYDANENRTETIKPEGNSFLVTHDERDLVLSQTRGAGTALAATITFDYDRNGNRVRVTDAEDTDGDGEREASVVVHDGFDRPVEAIDALSTRRLTTYDPANNRVREQVLGHPAGAPTAAAVLLSDVRLSHDERNRAFRVDESVFVPAGQALARPAVLADHDGDGSVTARFEFDALSRQTVVVEDDLEVNRFVFDGASRLIETVDPLGNVLRTDYDRGGNPVRVVELDAPSAGAVAVERFVTRYVYDQLGRVVRATDNAGQTIRQSFDSRDNLIVRSDPEGPPVADPLGLFPEVGQAGSLNGPGNTCFYVYDGADRQVRQVCELRAGGTGSGAIDTSNPYNPDGQVSLRYVFDRNSRLLGVVDDNGRATSYGYDELDRLVSEQTADGELTTFAFDRDDNARTITDPNGTVITKTFDAGERVVESKVSRGAGVHGTTRETFAYDGLGRIVRSTDDNGGPGGGRTVEATYDSLGRLLEERFDGVAVSHSWEGDGSRRAVTYGGGRTITFAYDPIDRIVQAADSTRTIWSATWIGSGYRQLERAYGNGARLSYVSDDGGRSVGYDAIRRTVGVRHLDPSGVPLVERSYTYNRANQRTSERRLDDFGLRDVYQYDSSYRLSGVSYDEDGDAGAARRAASSRSYSYDGVGNRRSETAVVDAVSTSVSYTVNEVNEYTSVAGVAQVHDDKGNLIDDGSRLLAYDYKNRLTAVFDRATGRTVARYEYFADGRRALKRLFDASNELAREVAYTYDFANLCEERDAATGATEATFVYAPFHDRFDFTPVQVERTAAHPLGAGTRYLHENARGDIVVVTNEAGAVVERRVYDDFGFGYAQATKALVAHNAEGNPFWFHGQQLDEESGLYYMRARFYSPSLGRFIQRDPVWDAANVGNAYAFVSNGPTTRRDPTGTLPSWNDVENFFGIGEDKDSTALAAIQGFGEGLVETVQDKWNSASKRIEDRATLLYERGDSDAGVVLGVLGMEISDNTGMTDLYEAGSGMDFNKFVETGNEHRLSTGERILKGVTGGVSLVSSAVGGAGALAKGKCVMTKGPGGNCFVAGTLVATDDGLVEIERLRVGDRVLADESEAPPEVPIHPSQWRKLVVSIPNPDGSNDRIQIELLRPALWVAENVVGGYVMLELDELDIRGVASVHAVLPCPEIEQGRGRVVTATFTHLNAELVEVSTTGSSDPVVATNVHRFYSEDRGWVAAGRLLAGERLRVEGGSFVAVRSADRRTGTERVYNLEVEGAHTYYVGESSILVHNNYFKFNPGEKPRYAPDPKKWQDKGGSIERNADGSIRYTDWDGNAVDYRGGHPDFRGSGHVRDEVEIDVTGDRTVDRRLAEAELEAQGRAVPPATELHHHEDVKTMQWVDEAIHGRFNHQGGVSKKNKKK